jgi:hypothetical protein
MAYTSTRSFRAIQLRSTSGVLVGAKLGGSDVRTDLMSGDVIRSVNRTAVTSVEALRSMMGNLVPGDSAVLQIERRRFKLIPIDID